MKRWLPWIICGIFVLELGMALVPRPETGLQAKAFGKLPVLLNGRVQPLDSVARNALLQIRGTQSVPLEGNLGDGREWGDFLTAGAKVEGKMEERHWYQFSKHPKRLKPAAWLIELFMKPELADQRYVFVVNHPDLINELGLREKGVENSGLHYYTFSDIKPGFEKIQKEGQRIAEAKIEAQQQTPYEKAILKLQNALMVYHRLKHTMAPERSENFAKEVAEYKTLIGPGVAAARAREAKKEYDQAVFDRFVALLEGYDFMSRVGYPLMVPPLRPEKGRDAWEQVGGNLMNAAKGAEVHPAVEQYAAMVAAYRADDIPAFNGAIAKYNEWLAGHLVPELKKGEQESFFSNLLPFYRALLMYLFAFILGCVFWFNWSEALRISAFRLTFIAFLLHTFGLIFRMHLEGRPPVTNLYSSAIFIGWGAVILGMILERIYKDGIGIVVASGIGFITQIIAHNLALGGDTMEMLQAVLDTNFWLATHVVVVTLGYASTFVAGFLAVVYVLRGVLTKTLSEATGKGLARMVYGIVCFATLFSFVGTVLGGIWADQSWGRFWGWDPKENGALIIVIWNALILHARWGGMVKERGLINLAVFGNVVTAFSWFGTNMLGVGLHAYGFMDAAFNWLMIFTGSQILIIALGLLPTRSWRSIKDRAAKVVTGPVKNKPASA